MIEKMIFGAVVCALANFGVKKAYESWRETKKFMKEGEMLEKEMKDIIELYKADREEFDKLCKRSFSNKNPDDAIEASIELARHVGVPEDQILHNLDELDHYFLD